MSRYRFDPSVLFKSMGQTADGELFVFNRSSILTVSFRNSVNSNSHFDAFNVSRGDVKGVDILVPPGCSAVTVSPVWVNVSLGVNFACYPEFFDTAGFTVNDDNSITAPAEVYEMPSSSGMFLFPPEHAETLSANQTSVLNSLSATTEPKIVTLVAVGRGTDTLNNIDITFHIKDPALFHEWRANRKWAGGFGDCDGLGNQFCSGGECTADGSVSAANGQRSDQMSPDHLIDDSDNAVVRTQSTFKFEGYIQQLLTGELKIRDK